MKNTMTTKTKNDDGEQCISYTRETSKDVESASLSVLPLLSVSIPFCLIVFRFSLFFFGFLLFFPTRILVPLRVLDAHNPLNDGRPFLYMYVIMILSSAGAALDLIICDILAGSCIRGCWLGSYPDTIRFDISR